MGEKQEFTEMRVHRGFLAVHRNGKRIPNEEVVNLLNSQSAEIAGLRKACRGILAATKGKRLNDYDRIPIPTADLIALHEALGNPSEIPNSSEVPDAAKG